MTACFISSVGIAAPGLAGWNASLDILRGAAPYVAIAETPYAPTLLPPNERRRATASVRQAFRAAEDAVAGSGGDARELASVFASSDADMTVLHRICAALAKEPRVISPTDFHNSVHNAASGYWSIAVQSQALTTTLSAYDASFTAGLLEAVGLVDARRDVLLVVYDAVSPQPLLAKRPLAVSASVAVVLSAHARAGALGRVVIGVGDAPESQCANPELEALRTANPALRALPLFELLAAKRAASVNLRGTGESQLALSFTP
ncbi:MAG: beta-ketoacyl synthase chain length factor [Pseudomonadota bacterium]